MGGVVLTGTEHGARAAHDASISPIQVGDVVAGKYRVDRVLGEGGMGIVVAATHQQLDEKVALKFLRPSVASNPEIVARFVREARAAVKIRSEHVARVLDVGALESGAPYMVMEYLDGQDLAQTLAGRGSLPVSETITYVLQACEAVAEAHSLGTVHRDLKPANLFLARRPNGRPVVKVLDFGISKVASTGEHAALTNASAMMGSPSYMSPEQMVAAGSVDVRADVWALGVVLYELLTGRLPFVAETMPELVGMILQSAHTPVAALRPDVPPGLQATIDRCLQKDRNLRQRNVAELAAGLVPFGPPRSDLSLERISHVLGLTAGPEQTASASLSPAALAAGATFSPVVSSKTGPSRRRLLVLVPAPILVIAACVGILFAWPRSGRPLQSPVPAATAALVAPTAVATESAGPATPAALTAPTAISESVAALPAPTVLEPPAPRAMSAVPTRPRPAVTPPPSASAGQPASPACHTVSYFDSDGNRHFRQECR
jgi:serine/threonine protein kinase